MRYSNKNVESVKNAKIERLIQNFNEDPSKQNFYKVLNLLYAAGEINRKFVQPYIEGIDDVNPDKLEISFSGVPYAVSENNPDANETMRFAEIYTSLDKCKNIAVGEFVEYAAVSIIDFFHNVLMDDSFDGIVINMGTDEFTLTKAEMQEAISMKTLINNHLIEEAILDYNKQDTDDNLDIAYYNISLVIRTGGCFLVPKKTHEDGQWSISFLTYVFKGDPKKHRYVNVYTNYDYFFYDTVRASEMSNDESISLEYIDIKKMITDLNTEYFSGIVINPSSRTEFLLNKDEFEIILDLLKDDVDENSERANWDVHHEELEKLIADYNKNPVSKNRQKVIDCLKYKEMELFLSPFIYDDGICNVPTLKKNKMYFTVIFSNYDEYLNWNINKKISMAGAEIKQCLAEAYHFDPEGCCFAINPYGKNPFFFYKKDIEYILFDN